MNILCISAKGGNGKNLGEERLQFLSVKKGGAVRVVVRVVCWRIIAWREMAVWMEI